MNEKKKFLKKNIPIIINNKKKINIELSEYWQVILKFSSK